MRLNDMFHRIAQKVLRASACVAAVAALTGCDSFIFENEGDCDPKFRVKLRYDKNMKFADAFSNEVNAVTLYVIDPEGNVVHRHKESGERVKADGYEIVLDGKVKPGNYRLLAWCGDGHLDENNSFRVTDTDIMENLTCRLLGDHEISTGARGEEETPGGFHSARELQGLYHHLTEVVEFPDEEGYHYYTMTLMKDTNSIKIVLQHLSGQPVDEDMFEFTVTGSNGKMNYDNSLLPHEQVTYHAWSVKGGSAEITDDSHTGTYSALIAELTIGRLVEGEDVKLNVIRKATDTEPAKTVVSLPLIDLALLVKGEANRRLTDQEYLDYQDDYNFLFFLDENYRWSDMTVYINSWKHVIQIVDDL